VFRWPGESAGRLGGAALGLALEGPVFRPCGPAWRGPGPG